MNQYDVIVIGAGPGGYPAAIRAAQLGAKVALVEREWVGGTCLNCGCIPTKTLIAGADLAERIRHADELGLKVAGMEIDYPAMAERKDQVVETLRSGVESLVKANGIDLIMGEAAFSSRVKLEVKDAAGPITELSAEKIIIATGSTSVMPTFLPNDERIVDSRAFLDLKQLPKTLLVLGGGYIGCELACMAAALGVKVTLVELLDDILMLLGKDVRQVVKRNMKGALGITLRTGEAMESVEVDADGVRAKVGGDTLEAEMLLTAVGRTPVTDGLHLEKAGLSTDEKGFLNVDAYNRTDAPGIYAIGDVTGRVQLAHAATSQGVYAAELACGHSRRSMETLIPSVIFTMPEVAMVGMTDAEAKDCGHPVATGKFFFRGLGKGLAAGETQGFVKWLADEESGQLLGAAAVGPHVTDLIAEAAVAIRAELTVQEIGATVHAHPTFSEIWMEAAHAVEGLCIHAPPRKKPPA